MYIQAASKTDSLEQGSGTFLAQRAIKVAHVEMYSLESHMIFLTATDLIHLAVIHVLYDLIQHDY